MVVVVVVVWWWCSGDKYPAGGKTRRDKIICIKQNISVVICFIHSMLGENPTQTNSKTTSFLHAFPTQTINFASPSFVLHVWGKKLKDLEGQYIKYLSGVFVMVFQGRSR